MNHKLALAVALLAFGTVSQAANQIRVPIPGISSVEAEGPSFRALTSSVDFGIVELTTMESGTLHSTVHFKNSAKTPLSVSSVFAAATNPSAPAELTIASNSCNGTIPGGGTCAVTVTYTVARVQNMAGALHVIHNGEGGETLVPIKGTPAQLSMSIKEVSSGASLNFYSPVVNFGSTSSYAQERVALVTNTSPVLPFTVILDSATSDTFAIVGDTCRSKMLEPGESCQLTLRIKDDAGIIPRTNGRSTVFPLTYRSKSGLTNQNTALVAMLYGG